MFRTKFLTARFVTAFIFVLVLSATAYAFAAANTVDASRAGDGAGVISGYNITSIVYTHVSGNPTKIASVAFNVADKDSANTDSDKVYARFTDASGGAIPGVAWTTCTFSSSKYSCSFPSPFVDVVGVFKLQVVAYNAVTNTAP
ncbi:MAG: hypothetical protein DWI57_05680 [Chloroflexi bacterium]|nr:MAG: hypothetical protein DWI57_05680 [Chloroflexota bacterium]